MKEHVIKEFKAAAISLSELRCLLANLEKEILYLKNGFDSGFSYEFFINQLQTAYNPIHEEYKKDD